MKFVAEPAAPVYIFTMSIAEIQNTVSALPERDRGLLAMWLLDSLPPHNAEDATNDGVEEAARRRQELDSGQVRPLNSDEFWSSVAAARAACR
jgi:hypothetical protein